MGMKWPVGGYNDGGYVTSRDTVAWRKPMPSEGSNERSAQRITKGIGNGHGSKVGLQASGSSAP